MPRRNVYLPADLDDQARQAGLSLSEVLQQALRQILSGAALREALPDSLATKPTLSRAAQKMAAQKMAARKEPPIVMPSVEPDDTPTIGAQPR